MEEIGLKKVEAKMVFKIDVRDVSEKIEKRKREALSER
jgi:hypothetical protein